MKNVLAIGASGLVGSRFVELYSKKYKFITPEYPDFDITDFENTKSYIKKSNPDVIVNFAAFTDVGGAENQRDDKNGSCWKINVDGVENLIKSISSEVQFIQISTDMVFPGSSDDPGPYSENKQPELDSKKLTWYGFTKAEGERVLKGRGNTSILRIIYPVRSKYDLKLDYLRRPLSLFDQGRLYPMFTDQWVSFAYIDEVCSALEKIIDRDLNGTFHASSSDTSTPFDIVSYLLKEARQKENVVAPSSLDEFLKTVDNPVRYPKYGGLIVRETEKRLGIKFSKIKDIIDKVVSGM